MDYEKMYKIIIIGNANVGKSNLLIRYTRNEFTNEENPTIGADFYSKFIVIDKVGVKLQIWDTAGQEHFRSIVKAYYKGISGAMIVYDITRRDTFEKLDSWLQEIENNVSGQKIPIVIAGNKKDLYEERQVSVEEGVEFCKQRNLFFLETSAKDNSDNMVEKIFLNLAENVHKFNLESKPEDIQEVGITKKLDIKTAIKTADAGNKCPC